VWREQKGQRSGMGKLSLAPSFDLFAVAQFFGSLNAKNPDFVPLVQEVLLRRLDKHSLDEIASKIMPNVS